MAASADSPEGRLAVELYERIIGMSNSFLHHCKNFPIEILALSNPTYEEIAQQFRRLAEIVGMLAVDFDPMMGQKSYDYCMLMSQMGTAIRNKDVDKLSELTEVMARRPGL